MFEERDMSTPGNPRSVELYAVCDSCGVRSLTRRDPSAGHTAAIMAKGATYLAPSPAVPAGWDHVSIPNYATSLLCYGCRARIREFATAYCRREAVEPLEPATLDAFQEVARLKAAARKLERRLGGAVEPHMVESLKETLWGALEILGEERGRDYD